MWDNLFSPVSLLEKGVSASWLRNEVINNNIANQDTPGFKASKVEFETLMAQAMGKEPRGLAMQATDSRHITRGAEPSADKVQATVTTEDQTSMRYDENNVDIESEMAALAKNTIEYYTLVSKLNSEFRKLDSAINVT